MKSLFDFLPSRIRTPSHGVDSTAGDHARRASAELTSEDYKEKDAKRNSDNASTSEFEREEIATAADPTLNPGALTFEEGTLASFT